MTNWQAFPKTELHLHLEGAAPVDFIRAQATQKGLNLDHVIEGDHYKWSDFNAFLKTYEEVMRALTTPEDFGALTKAVLANQASHGVKYTEITLGVILMSQNDPARWNEMMAAIEAASDEAEKAHGITARFTAVAVRHFDAEAAAQSAELVARHPSQRITGFGMAGAEEFKRPADFKRAFEIAGEAGFGLTCHAGEWCEAEYIRETIDALHVTRIGHGVRSAYDLSLMDELKARDIHAEICPGSNVSLGVYPSFAAHSIKDFKARGMSYSISTDDPPFFLTNMTREYSELAKLGWDEAEFNRSNLEAMRHAFCDEATRQRLAENWH